MERKNFAKLQSVYEMPNLVDIQLCSYEEFLQPELPKTKRRNRGLQAVFNEVFPIESYDKAFSLEFISYTLGKPKYNIDDCRKRAMSYAAPLRIKVKLRSSKEVKEQEVYLADLPLMTPTGTFIINGDERVVVSQLHRSPGVSFEEDVHPNGKRLYSARIIPYRGAWVEFQFDINDCIYVFLDRKRKMIATTFIRALGYSSDAQILSLFCKTEKVEVPRKSVLYKYVGAIIAKDITDPSSDRLIANALDDLSEAVIDELWNCGIRSVKLVNYEENKEIINTLRRDSNKTTEDALVYIYRRLRPGDPPNIESAKTFLQRLFFDSKRYDFEEMGRHMLNRKLDMNVDLNQRVLDNETVLTVLKRLIRLKNGEGTIDDIDHLGNRRIRSVGEQLQNQFRIALARVERSIKERMAIYDPDTMMPHNLINSKLVSSVVKDFFGRSQLSQFMDQTNPLAELTHKRRLSALGPGGLSRERAGFEVRDVHTSHYGRVCPIETPEGPNIGLIVSLSTYAKRNEFGFLETPYRKVIKGRATDQIDYLSADEEDKYVIAQANARIDDKGKFLDEAVSCRLRGNFPKMSPEKIDYMDVSPVQLVSVAASLIPFLEHDDANRALMGSNMQRQAVPLLQTDSPLVGTGIEYRAAKDSGSVVVARVGGIVNYVDAERIVVNNVVYELRKFERSNANTCINQRPIVKKGERVKAGDVVADGAATDDGELALGRNILVAFMSWRGYNFEDAILISEKVVKEDMYTSVHIEEFEIEARETRLGNEEITRDIPNVSEEALRNLDESGIVRIGAEVKPGDILVGKVVPKSETELTPEEKLLRAIFGEKAGDVRDASLLVPPGIDGVIVDVRIFSRKEARTRTKEEIRKERSEVEKVKKEYEGRIGQIQEEKAAKLSHMLIGKELASPIIDEVAQEVIVKARKKITSNDVKKIVRCSLEQLKISDESAVETELKKLSKVFDDQIEELVYEQEKEIDRIKRGDELPPGVIKKVVVYVASKRKLSVGDKMAGRHGNKGVIAKVLPEEDMPFLPDGTPVEIVLNPLGVPSRMNVGQILETHLGWAAKALGIKVASSVFDGAREEEIKDALKKAGLPEDGKTVLFDGYSGKSFDQLATVGYIYMMKLAHLVDDKIHARSIGPYSLVTQQPLGGKAQFGGQRFGEMEVWALEAYGAAYCLQELLTVKSDDVAGRTRVYEAIVKGENSFQTGTPESFNVLVKELQSLGLDVKMEKISQDQLYQ
ncbi:MAG: DNA-directed RNA polymerase subunit beta [Candidatus Omnitrophica bacterium]|nr:DNA-directed RNA polymerase subunit beta [Candidatus Omnitrophota bacterium]